MTQGLPRKPRILYAFQGTGNGHTARANEIIPLLKRWSHVTVVCSGLNRQLALEFEIDLQFEGISFEYNSQGGLSIGRTIKNMKLGRFLKDVKGLDLTEYDIVINDFEPVTAWACRLKQMNCLALGHQAAFLSKASPRPPKRNLIAEWLFRNYAPAQDYIGFHFKAYDHFIFPPVLRQQVFAMERSKGPFIVCYLPAYEDSELFDLFSQISNREFRIFSKKVKEVTQKRNCRFEPIHGDAFLDAIASAHGVISSAGFETPAEALYLGKKLLVVPIRGQYEQYCNAAALSQLGVTVLRSLNKRSLGVILQWVYEGEPLNCEVLETLEPFLKQEVVRRLNSASLRLV